jgi:hypothetical protein
VWGIARWFRSDRRHFSRVSDGCAGQDSPTVMETKRLNSFFARVL